MAFNPYRGAMRRRNLRAQARGALIWAKIDMEHYNAWYRHYLRLKKINSEKANKKEGLELTKNIQKTCRVRSGRYRMGWTGVNQMEGVQPPRVRPKVRRVHSLFRPGKSISAARAQREGRRLAKAKEFRQGESFHGLQIVNAVSYGPVEEARYGNVRRAIKFRTQHYMKAVARMMEKVGKDSQR